MTGDHRRGNTFRETPHDLVLIGAGQRGLDVYGRYALEHPRDFRVIAVAEPDPLRRARAAALHGVPPERCFESWEPLLAGPRQAGPRQGGPRLGRAAVVATQDALHLAPATAALRAGYDVLLEKPMASGPADCVALDRTVAETGRTLMVCHVLRYTPALQALHGLLRAGELGQVVSLQHSENLAYWHMAHAYVRGHWRRAAESSPMILAKSCHDLDLVAWLVGRPCARLASFGSLQHFRAEQAPAGAPERCTDGCPVAADCPWEAERIYLGLEPLLAELAEQGSLPVRLLARVVRRPAGRVALRALARVVPPLRALTDYHHWPRSVVSDEPGEAALRRALQTGPYGRCVYRCDNDVVDHQTVAMEFEGGATASFTVQGHAHRERRVLRVDGTRGTALLTLGWFVSELEVRPHGRGGKRGAGPSWKRRWRHPLGQGHAGGDAGLMRAFAAALDDPGREPLTSARASVESHLLAFAAEHARTTGAVVDLAGYREALRPP